MFCVILLLLAVSVVYLAGPNFDFQVAKDLYKKIIDKFKNNGVQ